MEKLSKKKFWKVSKKSNKVKWRISFCLNLTRNKVPRKEKLQLPFSQIYISNFYCTCEMCEKSPFHTMNNLNVPIQCNPYLFQLGRINNLLQHLFNWFFNHAGYSCCTTQLVRPCTLCIAQPQKIWFYCTIGIIWEQMSSSASVSASLRLIFKPQSCSAQFVMVLIGSVCNHLHLCDWFFNWEQTALNKYLHCLAGRVA